MCDVSILLAGELACLRVCVYVCVCFAAAAPGENQIIISVNTRFCVNFKQIVSV